MRGCALRKVVRNLAHKNWKTGESNPSTSLHRSRYQRHQEVRGVTVSRAVERVPPNSVNGSP